MKKEKKRIVELDALRAVAAVSVMFYHYTYGFNHSDTHTFFHKGFLGVELFFVVSGFVIFMTLKNIRSSKQFVVSRFSRLYPAYWFSIILSFVLFSIPLIFNSQLQPNFKVNPISVHQFLSNLTMLQAYFGVQDIDGVYWTLAIELMFYVVMLGIYIIKKLDKIEVFGWFYVIALFLVYKYFKSVNLVYIRYGLYFLAGIIYYNVSLLSH